MVSKFGWIDFSEKERRQMLDVVHLFSERETRDELGIGTIRDSFAEHFFPGTSTIQTRAKYMLLIPWIYMELENKKVPSAKISARARRAETSLISTLLKNGDEDGVIGIEAKKNLVRLPSSIYWTGLASWGIRLFSGSITQYHGSLDSYYRQNHSNLTKESDEENVNHKISRNWHPAIPKPPKDLSDNARLPLKAHEAAYLKERVLIRHPNSLLAEMLRINKVYKTDFPWVHPAVGSMKPDLTTSLFHARNFSEVMHGAALLYNLMLSEAAEGEDLVRGFEKRLDDWVEAFGARNNELRKWYKNITNFWTCTALNASRIPPLTRSFVNKWFQFVFESPGAGKIARNKSVQNLIFSRESQLKGSRARLSNQSALNRWRGESGTGRLTYRWKTASKFVADILNGLRGE